MSNQYVHKGKTKTYKPSDDAMVEDRCISKYEYAKLLSARATALSNGAPPIIDISNKNLTSVSSIVREEYLQNKFLYKIVRPGRNGDITVNPSKLLKYH